MSLTCKLFALLSAPGILFSSGAAEFFQGAPPPGDVVASSPLLPAQQQASFALPPGFEIELVASESEGIGKFVTVAWDLQGRMWSMTALEYPVDANESPEVAKALYASRAKDKVLVWDDTTGPGPHQPRVFAEGLAIPLGILPYKNGVYVQHGAEIAFLADSDGDGKADQRQTILRGFGVQDSHLFPHQFTRAPGNWIWFAQGAFNYGKVKTSTGAEQQFDQTRMAKFRPDGSDFVITSQGPCNIWGLVLNAEGEAFIQEANDYGYPVMPFHEHANYPGCSDAQFKSYAPEFPPTAPHFQVGGTGLSGLALSDASGAWPEPYAGIFYLANPITRKIQAVRIERDGPRYKYEKLPDFVLSSDPMFRPVSIQFGPDGCLYIVDWYNKIISHNEVPRAHPERDKTRGRIWRVKHQNQTPFPVPDFTRLTGSELVQKLGGNSTAQSHLAWQAIGDRKLIEIAPDLKRSIADHSGSAAQRIASLWALEALGKVEVSDLENLLSESNRNIRREALRILGEIKPPVGRLVSLLKPLANDPDPEVRAQLIRTLAPRADETPEAMALCVSMARPSLDGPTARSTANGRIIKVGEAYERDFERYLVRMFLEEKSDPVRRFLASREASDLPLENRMVAALAMEPKSSATPIARLVEQLGRAPNEEELLRLAQFPAEPEVKDALEKLVAGHGAAVLEALLKVRNRFDAGALKTLLEEASGALFGRGGKERELALRLASGFKLAGLEASLVRALQKPGSPEETVLLLKALREMGTSAAEVLTPFLAPSGDRRVKGEALAALASSRHQTAPALLLQHWDGLNHLQRRTALDQLSGTEAGASALVRAVQQGSISKRDLSQALIDKITLVLPDDAELARLKAEILANAAPVLRLNGQDDAWLEARITLDGPFTVETWIKLEGGINNEDGILGAPGVLDINFAGGHFRAWVAGLNDVIIAKKKIEPEVWTHVAIARNEKGNFRIYLNGELDSESSTAAPQKFENLRLGWSTPPKGTLGALAEYRIWNVERSSDEIRANFDRSYDSKPAGLEHYFTGTNWPGQHPSAQALMASDLPPVQSSEEARAVEQKFERYRALLKQEGSAEHGRTLFATVCLACHKVGGEGGAVGPVLNGAGAMDPEGLLRAILTPNAAMEAGYRTFRVELASGDILDGFLVSQDSDAIILRRPNAEDQRIPQDEIRRAEYLRTSLMPEGLLEGFQEKDAADLLAYLKTLK